MAGSGSRASKGLDLEKLGLEPLGARWSCSPADQRPGVCSAVCWGRKGLGSQLAETQPRVVRVPAAGREEAGGPDSPVCGGVAGRTSAPGREGRPGARSAGSLGAGRMIQALLCNCGMLTGAMKADAPLSPPGVSWGLTPAPAGWKPGGPCPSASATLGPWPRIPSDPGAHAPSPICLRLRSPA